MLQIKKGESLNITKAAADAGVTLSNLIAGAGWDPASEGAEIDLDLMVVLVGEDGKALPDKNGQNGNLDEALCYFDNKEGIPGLKHTGDNLTGQGDGDDEQIHITLSSLPTEAKKALVVIASYSGQPFGQVKSAFVRLEADGKELGRYELTENYGDTKGVVMGELVRNGDNWEFKALGEKREGDFNKVLEGFGLHS